MSVSREEKVSINLFASVTEDSLPFLSTQMELLKQKVRPLRDGDTVQIKYDFDLDYMNGIDKRFEVICNLLQSDSVQIKSVSYSELNHGRILLQDLLNKIDIICLEGNNAADRGKTEEQGC